MISRALDKDNDWILSGGSFALTSQGAQVVQKVRSRLQLFMGEWFLDTDAGTPWYQNIFTKPADLVNIESILKTIILRTEGVLRLLTFTMDYDGGDERNLMVTYSAETTYGVIDIQEVYIND